MDIEFLGRFPKRKEITKEDRDLKRLLGQEDEESEDEIDFVYKPITIDIFDVIAHNEYDENHTMMRSKYGDIYVMKCKYNVFSALKESLTGKLIKSVDSFVFEVVPDEKNGFNL